VIFLFVFPVNQRDLQRIDTDFFYTGDDLGITYSKTETTFRIWAPLATRVVLIIYKHGDVASADPGVTYEMERSVKGTWVKTLSGDLHGIFYTYKVTHQGQEVEAPDPYAVAVGINGDRSAVVNLAATNPPGWVEDRRPPFSGRMTEAVIYELHIRDLSMHETSGIINKGKYLQFKETGRRGPGGVTTGIDHLKELGITHLHLLPTYDFASIDEKTLEKQEFNWGYDPKNYNTPEGSYATDPYDPVVRIQEYKEMIQILHQNGIRVIFDAVYNHTFHNYDSIFHRIVPGYYYRMTEDGAFLDGTGCGNETASERRMMRKFMVDSIKYWVNEYHIDGFRFDLMGIHDLETMREIRKAVDRIDQGIILFGEGWDMGHLPHRQRAIQPHAHQMPEIGFFNDHFRDNLKGPWNNDREHGFIDGRAHM
jgi:pullulanase